MSNLEPNIAPVFRFDPDWVKDPVPDWIFRRLDERVIADLSKVYFEARRTALTQELELVERVQAIVEKGLGR
jgi:hypothetical protein